MSTDVTMQELEPETAELLPRRETLFLPDYNRNRSALHPVQQHQQVLYAAGHPRRQRNAGFSYLRNGEADQLSNLL